MVYLIALFKTRFSPRSLLDLKKQELIFALPVLSTPTLVEKKKKKGFLSLTINQTFQSYSKPGAHIKKKS